MRVFLKKRTWVIHTIFIAALGGLLIADEVHAGFLSAVVGLFNTQDQEKSSVVENSQNIQLLQASRNINEKAARGGADVFVVDDSAILPESGPSGSSADVLESDIPKSDQISVYVVQDADTLSQIAEMFNVSVNTILWANDIPGGTITPGMRLAILPITGVRHTVAKGDTLASIAKKYGSDVDEIAGYNGITSDSALAVGNTVVVPDGEIAAPKSSSSSSKGSASSVAAGYFSHPVPGSVRTQGLHGYNGIDFGAPSGTPILAAASGEVIISRSGGWNGGYGNYVVIKHANGTQTLYAHNSSNSVYAGQSVKKGQVIGRIGSTGRSTGPHLHFEVRGAANPFAK